MQKKQVDVLLSENELFSGTTGKTRKMKKIELMDSTLRDGEQTAGVSFSSKEKESIAFALYDAGIRRIEMASACVSDQDFEAVKNTTKSLEDAGCKNVVECLSFIIKSHVDWITDSGATCANLLVKSSTDHVAQIRGKNSDDHIQDVLGITDYARENDLCVNVYLEHFSYGIQHSRQYVYDLIESLGKAKIQRIMLADTMGLLSTDQTKKYVQDLTQKFPGVHFDIHAHNDYGLATANTLAGIKSGCLGAHVTVNGLGERAGNASLETVAVSLKDFFGVETINEDKLVALSKLTKTLSGAKIEPNHPIVGKNSHVHKAGVHTHGASKGLYTNPLLEGNRFNKTVSYDLGKLSGKASVSGELEKMGIKNPDMEIVAQLVGEIKMLSEKKNIVTTNDLLLLYLQKMNKDAVGYRLEKINMRKVYTNTKTSALAEVTLRIGGVTSTVKAAGGGGFDAIANAVKKITGAKIKLKDYHVGIPPGDGTSSLVDTAIDWQHNKRTLKTRGIHTDQDIAATLAMIKAVNQVDTFRRFEKGKN